MPLYTDHVLYKSRQHVLILLLKFLRIFLPFCIVIFILGQIVFLNWSIITQIILGLIGGGCILAYEYFLWSKSYLLITNEKLVKKVRNGIFSKFHMSIHYDNIRDVAYSQNNILHYTLGCGSLFARSSAAAVGDFEALWTPKIEKVYKIVNYLHNIDATTRKDMNHIDGVIDTMHQGRDIIGGKSQETPKEAAKKEKQILLNIQGIKEVVELSDADRRYIFEYEEERNHGVFECLRRQVLFAATHDSTFREPDETIVMKSGEKVIFPVIDFHEVKRKKVSSSSPGLAIHEYLVPKFKTFGDYDATLLIGFDI